MKILLVRPPFTRLRKFGQSPVFPLGLGWIAAVLSHRGHQAMIYYPENPSGEEQQYEVHKESVFENRSAAHSRYLDALNNDSLPVWREIREQIGAYAPDVLGISLLSTEVGAALKVSRIAKALSPEMLVVWGGVHPSFETESSLAFPEVDLVVRGEGEFTMLDICDRLEHGQRLDDVAGISLRCGTRVRHNPDRPLLDDLDTLPPPSRDLVLQEHTFSKEALGGVITSRGCPWRCSFCSSRSFWRNTVRFRSPRAVADEIEALKRDKDIRSVTIWDDAFSLDRDHALSLCQELLDRRLRITWRGATRLDLINPGLLRLMRRSGCTQVEIGIESGSPRILREIRKDIEIDSVQEAISAVQAEGMACGVFFMAGFPQERIEDLEETLNVMRRITPAEMVLNVYDPLPGSELFELARAWSMVSRDEDWVDYRLWPLRHFVKDIDPEEFANRIEEISAFVFSYNRSIGPLLRRALPEVKRLLARDPARLLRKAGRFLANRFH
ncbi:radical SAM protein [bacterium]|nr:radical SAM protein [candidate division CSSED10-310 bacterium]